MWLLQCTTLLLPLWRAIWSFQVEGLQCQKKGKNWPKNAFLSICATFCAKAVLWGKMDTFQLSVFVPFLVELSWAGLENLTRLVLQVWSPWQKWFLWLQWYLASVHILLILGTATTLVASYSVISVRRPLVSKERKNVLRNFFQPVNTTFSSGAVIWGEKINTFQLSVFVPFLVELSWLRPPS